MPRCCGGATCACVIQEGAHIDIIGTGQPADPFVITGDVALQAVDNSVFDVTITGLGTTASPWALSVGFAPTAMLNDLPDVTALAPTNGQVLGWDSATSQWTPRAPTTAAAGSVTHDTSLAGDGSAGAPLQVAEDAAGYLITGSGGLGLTDAGKNRLVGKYTDATARAAATPAPTLNTLSLLDSAPGGIDYWNGTAWASAGGAFQMGPVAGEEMYQMSGPYAGGRMTTLVVNVTDTTDVNGMFDAISAAALAGRAGIMTAHAQPIAPPGGLAAIAIPYMVMLSGESGALRGMAFRVDDGTPYTLSPIYLTVTAWVY